MNTATVENIGDANENNSQDVLLQRHRLFQLRHALTCRYQESNCSPNKLSPPKPCPISSHCFKLKKLWTHLLVCKNDDCSIPLCVSSRFVLNHYANCQSVETCQICKPVRDLYGATDVSMTGKKRNRCCSEIEEREALKNPVPLPDRKRPKLIFNSYDANEEKWKNANANALDDIGNFVDSFSDWKLIHPQAQQIGTNSCEEVTSPSKSLPNSCSCTTAPVS